MKTLIYTISTSKCGTTKLSSCLKSIGVEAYHEHIGIEDLIYDWTYGLFNELGDLSKRINKFRLEFTLRILPHLEGEGVIADVSNKLSWFYPIIETLGIDTRCIFITRDARRIVPEYIGAGRKGEVVNHKVNNHYYPPSIYELYGIDDEDLSNYNKFTHWCYYWCMVNNYFMLSRKKHFRVEDFNNRSDDILNKLYPEATDEQYKIFKNEIQHTPSGDYYYHPRTWSKLETSTYNSICGSMLKTLGYKLL